MTRMCPIPAAKWAGVSPRMFAGPSGCAPTCNKYSTQAVSPIAEARCNGVSPSWFGHDILEWPV